jgi:hypothetical protein
MITLDTQKAMIACECVRARARARVCVCVRLKHSIYAIRIL